MPTSSRKSFRWLHLVWNACIPLLIILGWASLDYLLWRFGGLWRPLGCVANMLSHFADFLPKSVESLPGVLLGVAGSLLGTAVTLIIVAFSLTEIDRALVRDAFLLHPRTEALFGNLAGLVMVFAGLMLLDLPLPAVYWGQWVALAWGLTCLARYYRWFLASIEPNELVEVVLGQSGGPTAMRLLPPLMRYMADRRGNQLEQLGVLLATVVTKEQTALARDKKNQIQKVFEATLTDLAFQAVHTRNDDLLASLITAAKEYLKLAKPGEVLERLRMTLIWVQNWHTEFLSNSEYLAYERDLYTYACLELRLLIGSAPASEEEEYPVFRDVIDAGLRLVCSEIQRQVSGGLAFHDPVHLREVFFQYQGLTQADHRWVELGERRYALAILHLLLKAGGSEVDSHRGKPLLELGHELAGECTPAIDAIYRDLTTEELPWLHRFDHLFGIHRHDRFPGTRLAERMAEAAAILNALRRRLGGGDPLLPTEVTPGPVLEAMINRLNRGPGGLLSLVEPGLTRSLAAHLSRFRRPED